MIIGYDSQKDRYFMTDITEDEAAHICVLCQSVEKFADALDQISPEINEKARFEGKFPAEIKRTGMKIAGGEEISNEELEAVNDERKAADKRWDYLMEKIKEVGLREALGFMNRCRNGDI